MPHTAVQGDDVVIEPRPLLLELGEPQLDSVHTRTPKLGCAAQVLEHLALLGLVTVQLQTDAAELNSVQLPLHNLEGCHFLSNEEDCPPIGNRFSNDVGDGLRFPGSRRALDDHAPTAARIHQDHRLGRVSVQHFVDGLSRSMEIEEIVGIDIGLERLKPVTQNLADDTSAVATEPVGPQRRIKVLVHHVLRVGEEAELHLVWFNTPSRLCTDHPGDIAKVGLDIKLLIIRQVREFQPEVLLQLGLQREINAQLLPREANPEPCASVPLQCRRHEDERRHSLLLGALTLIPMQHPQG